MSNKVYTRNTDLVVIASKVEYMVLKVRQIMRPMVYFLVEDKQASEYIKSPALLELYSSGGWRWRDTAI